MAAPLGCRCPAAQACLARSSSAHDGHARRDRVGFSRAGTRDPIFAAVIAWALAAVAADGSRAARGLVDDATLDRLRKAARAGCGLAVLLACTQI